MRTATTKKNTKLYNKCTLEYIELSICTELSQKLEREKTFLRVHAGQQGSNKKTIFGI